MDDGLPLDRRANLRKPMSLSNTRLETPVQFPRENTEWHFWLQGRVDKALTIREHIENLPKTAVTFTAQDIDGLSPGLPYNPNLLKLAGSWQVPDTYTNNRKVKWVNPHATYSYRYSDAITRCACGTPMVKQAFSTKHPRPADTQEHTDCIRPDRLEARAELLRNRIEIIKEIYEYGHTVSGMGNRLGLKRDSSLGGDVNNELGLALEDLGQKSRAKVARTATVLMREYPATIVGELFGLSGKAISNIVTKETNVDTKMLYKHRRKYA